MRKKRKFPPKSLDHKRENERASRDKVIWYEPRFRRIYIGKKWSHEPQKKLTSTCTNFWQWKVQTEKSDVFFFAQKELSAKGKCCGEFLRLLGQFFAKAKYCKFMGRQTGYGRVWCSKCHKSPSKMSLDLNILKKS